MTQPRLRLARQEKSNQIQAPAISTVTEYQLEGSHYYFRWSSLFAPSLFNIRIVSLEVNDTRQQNTESANARIKYVLGHQTVSDDLKVFALPVAIVCDSTKIPFGLSCLFIAPSVYSPTEDPSRLPFLELYLGSP
jgi:hypothetical protein